MKAIVAATYGSAEVLELRDIDAPPMAQDEVLIEVRAAGVDRGVWHLMAGLPYPVRMAGYGLRTPKNPVLGMDVSGVVTAVGAAVTRFRPGDEVFGFAKGSFATCTRALERKLAPKPANLTFEQAAVVAVSGLPALQAVRDQAKVQPGQHVLITGASGGVGSYAVQVAKAFGAVVTGVASTAKLDLVRGLGADHVVDYTTTDFAAGPPRYDVILDIGGNPALFRLRRALTPTGTLVLVGGESEHRWLGGYTRQLRLPLVDLFARQRLRSLLSSENAADLLAMKELIEAGTVTPVIDRSYPLSETADAIRYLVAGRARGKVVITM